MSHNLPVRGLRISKYYEENKHDHLAAITATIRECAVCVGRVCRWLHGSSAWKAWRPASPDATAQSFESIGLLIGEIQRGPTARRRRPRALGARCIQRAGLSCATYVTTKQRRAGEAYVCNVQLRLQKGKLNRAVDGCSNVILAADNTDDLLLRDPAAAWVIVNDCEAQYLTHCFTTKTWTTSFTLSSDTPLLAAKRRTTLLKTASAFNI